MSSSRIVLPSYYAFPASIPVPAGICPLLFQIVLLNCMFHPKRLPVGLGSFKDVFSCLKFLSEGLYALKNPRKA